MNEQPQFWTKVWPQGMIDDGNDDDDVLNLQEEAPDVLKPRAEHNWIPYEPHTTAVED